MQANRAISGFTGMKVFSATKAKDRDELGDRVSAWLRHNPGVEVVDTVVNQSSDNEFHCLSIVLFHRPAATAAEAKAA